jgi:hypothetical protein
MGFFNINNNNIIIIIIIIIFFTYRERLSFKNEIKIVEITVL